MSSNRSKRVRAPKPVDESESHVSTEELQTAAAESEAIVEEPPVVVPVVQEEEVAVVEVKKVRGVFENDLRSLFSRANGYRLHPEDLKMNHLTVRLTKVSDKKLAEARAKAGRALKNMKDRYLNLNSLFSTIPTDDEILSKFVPGLLAKAKAEPFRVIQMSPPCKMKWTRLTGLGSFDKTKYAPENEESAEHEFSLNVGAYNEQFVDDRGLDPSAVAWLEHTKTIWNFITDEIIRNKEIAPELHKMCGADLEKDKPPSSISYEEAYAVNYRNKYVKGKDGDLEVKFGAKMFRFPTVEDRTAFNDIPYVAPNERMQSLYDGVNDKKQVIYNDFPVIRPKTTEEASKSFDTDPNPFIYVPYSERDQIKDNSIGSCLYEIAITENHQGKSYLKLKPLLLIWVRDVVSQKATTKKRDRPFVFGEVSVTEEQTEE
jgi:hypothetical protein